MGKPRSIGSMGVRRTCLVLAVTIILVQVQGDDTIDVLKQTLGRLNMAYQTAAQSKKTSDIDSTIELVSDLITKLGALKTKLRGGFFSETNKQAEELKKAARGTLTEMEVQTTSKPEDCDDLDKTQDGDWLKVHFVGKTLFNGKVFDSSFHTGSLPVKFMIGDSDRPEGWSLGMTGMCEGERRKIILPSKLAFGEAGGNGVPPGADVSYDVELVSFYSPKRDRDEA